MLLKEIAQKISNETTKIIGFPVTISDENGYIIGVNDQSRIGLYDNLLSQVIKTKKLTYYDEASVANYPDIFPGVASPIIVNDKTLGAVGIIGKTKEDLDTKNYILLVKNHIEMVCHEAIKKEIKSLETNSIDTFIQYILNFNSENHNEEHIKRYSKMLNFDLNLNRVCLVIEVLPEDKSSEEELGLKNYDDFLDIVSSYLLDHADLIGRLSFDQFCILKHVDKEGISDGYMQLLRIKMKELNSILRNRHNVSVIVSIGNVVTGIKGLQTSYQNALQTLETYAKTDSSLSILDYNLLSNKLSIMMETLPKDFFYRIEDTLQPLVDHDNYQVFAETFIAYCESKFNLSDAARNLFIHRNSLIYRLKQISKISKINVNNFEHCLLLYLFIKKVNH